MKKPAIFIDAYITNEEKKKWFDYNLSNYIKHGWDVFIISNKMPSFDKFSDIRYFEYDSKNRILPDMSKYKLRNGMEWNYQLYDNVGSLFFNGESLMHGFTNWTILYNLKKICKVLKRNGFEHMIRCEYDVIFKDYNLMNNIFKNFGLTKKSKNCMVMPDKMGCTTNFFLINVDYLDSKIPELETEQDYINYMNTLYGSNISPVFEGLLDDLIKNDCEYINKEESFSNIENLGICMSDGDIGMRHKILYKNLLMTPVNNNSEFFFHNGSKDKAVYIQYTTGNGQQGSTTSLHLISPNSWYRFGCREFVEIKTSDMKSDESIRFDLDQPCAFKLVRN